jgi:hypothetical protein
LRSPYGALTSAPLVLLKLDNVTELVGKAMLSGFRRGKRFCPYESYPPVSMPSCRPAIRLEPKEFWTRASTARAKGAIGRLNFHFTLVLSARGEPECAARGLNNRAAGPLVWIVHKLVEPNL